MQLTSRRRGRISQALGCLTANLLAATCAHAQALSPTADTPPDAAAPRAGANDDTESDVGMTRLNAAVLFYREAGGRVKATEPVASIVINGSSGAVLTARFTVDSLTGATPNGAAPWTGPQTFVTPAHAAGTTATVTGASGGSTLVTIPGTGTVARQYVTPANTLPVDAGFRDLRTAVDLGYSTPVWDGGHLSLGGSASTERDYRSFSGNAGVSQDFNQHNTTASLSVEYEYDRSNPFFGTPTPFTPMSADVKGPDRTKTVTSAVLGVTQVVNRYWLAQLNYSVGQSSGYQTDPYRVLSVVDPVSGAPSAYLYENRPSSRLRQSVYFGNKVALGPTVTDASVRVYHDSWGVNSVTTEVSERVSVVSWLYVEPLARYYSQTAASFFRDYLIAGQPLPSYASSDSRIGKFQAVTYGLKVGIPVTGRSEFDIPQSELYFQVQDYRQTGPAQPSGVVPGLARENFFSGVRALSVIAGYTMAFY